MIITSGHQGDFISWKLDQDKNEVVLSYPGGIIRIAYIDLFDVVCALEAAEDSINGVEYPDNKVSEES